VRACSVVFVHNSTSNACLCSAMNTPQRLVLGGCATAPLLMLLRCLANVAQPSPLVLVQVQQSP
jgi:hypothetical protein